MKKELQEYSDADFEFSLFDYHFLVIKRKSNYDILLDPFDTPDIKRVISKVSKKLNYDFVCNYYPLHGCGRIQVNSFKLATSFFEAFILCFCKELYDIKFPIEVPLL